METNSGKLKAVRMIVVWAFIAIWCAAPWISPATAVEIDAGSADGSTSCNGLTCTADVYNLNLPASVNVNDWDEVVYTFDVEWEDTRPANQLYKAVHTLIIHVMYMNTSIPDAFHEVETYGGESDSTTLELKFTVFEHTAAPITFIASIYVDHPFNPCEDDDSDGGWQRYV